MTEQKIAPVLSDEDIGAAYVQTGWGYIDSAVNFARAIEQAVLARVGAVRDQALEEAALAILAGDAKSSRDTDYMWDSDDCARAIRALKGTPAAAVADALPVIPGTPPRIWLVLGDDGDEPANFDELAEVTWCAHPQGPGDIEYVLAQPSTNPGPLAAVEPQGLPAWWSDFIQNVCELPDRNSPEGEPDAMIATAEELENAALAAIAASKEGVKS